METGIKIDNTRAAARNQRDSPPLMRRLPNCWGGRRLSQKSLVLQDKVVIDIATFGRPIATHRLSRYMTRSKDELDYEQT